MKKARVNIDLFEFRNSDYGEGLEIVQCNDKKAQIINLPKTRYGRKIVSIGNDAFSESMFLKELILPNSVKRIGDRAFQGCHSLSWISFSSDLELIGCEAFKDCVSLDSVFLPYKICCISNSMFANCTSLSSVVFNGSINTIESNAFLGCTSLKVISISESPFIIKESAFSGCASLMKVKTGSSRQFFEQNVIIERDNDAFKNAYFAFECVYNEEYGMERDETFEYRLTENNNVINLVCLCKKITEVDLEKYFVEKTVLSIGEEAFSNCKALTSINIPDSVREIGAKAFENCHSLKKITLPANLKEIKKNTFCDCRSLQEVIIPDGVISIGEQAFYSTQLTSVVIPNTVTVINWKAFSFLPTLICLRAEQKPPTWIDTRQRVVFGYIGIIGKFDNIDYVIELIEESQTVAIVGCTEDSREVNIPDEINGKKVTRISDYAFRSRRNLISVVLSKNITSIGAGAFSFCTSLTFITICSAVVSIGNKAFFGCKSLRMSKVFEGLRDIGSKAFFNCTSLQTFVIPKTTQYIGHSAFENCTSLVIYCRASKQPTDWDYYWNISNRPVFWGQPDPPFL